MSAEKRGREEEETPKESKKETKEEKEERAEKRKHTHANDTIVTSVDPSCTAAWEKFFHTINKNRTNKKLVMIWDLDETLIIFNSLINGQYVSTHTNNSERDISTSKYLATNMEKLIMDILDEQMFFSELENVDLENVLDLNSFDDHREINFETIVKDFPVHESNEKPNYKHMSYRYRLLKDAYSKRKLKTLLKQEQREQIKTVVKEIERFCSEWSKNARELLEITKSKYHAHHYIVTSGQLIPTMLKLVIYKLSKCIPVENIYSSAFNPDGKTNCFKRIIKKTLDEVDDLNSRESVTIKVKPVFIAIGDGKEERLLARTIGIAFQEIRSSLDLKRLTEIVK